MSYFIEPGYIISPQEIKNLVAKKFNLTSNALDINRRFIELIIPKSIAIYLIRKYCRRKNNKNLELQYYKIGEIFKMENHSSIFQAVKKVKGWIEFDKKIREQVIEIENELIKK